MRILKNWRGIIRKAWSIKLMVLAGILSGFEVILPFFSDHLPRGFFASLSFLVVSAAFVARLVAQKEMSSDDDDEK